jgi:hypothetical protein
MDEGLNDLLQLSQLTHLEQYIINSNTNHKTKSTKFASRTVDEKLKEL